MDKRVIFAVAGSGKTTHIVKSLDADKRSLILTYTRGTYQNLKKKIIEKFHGKWPENITLMTYFEFLYSFCYKPFLADKIKAKGIVYEPNSKNYLKKENDRYYLSKSGYFYSNRIAFSFEHFGIIDDIKERIERYFDELIIDEIQDVSGRDFNFLLKIMEIEINIVFVGDFFQHTFDTSRDGNVNKNLFKSFIDYKEKFSSKGFIVDEDTLDKSWRCNKLTCSFIRDNLGINIYSHQSENRVNEILLLDDIELINQTLNDDNIIKLHYENSSKYGKNNKNWGETKGEDYYQDICIVLNQNTEEHFKNNTLDKLAPSTKNKLYVALTRARGNTYFISHKDLSK